MISGIMGTRHYQFILVAGLFLEGSKGFDEAHQILMIPPDTRVEKIRLRKPQSLIEFRPRGCLYAAKLCRNPVIDHLNSVFGHFQGFHQVLFGVLRDGNDLSGVFRHGTDHPVVSPAMEEVVHLLAREEGQGQVVDRDDKRVLIKNGSIEVRKVHQVQFFLLYPAPKAELFANRIVGKISQDLLKPGTRRLKTVKSFLSHEEDVFVLLVQFCQMLNQLRSISSDPGKGSPVHACINANLHDFLIAQIFIEGKPKIWYNVLISLNLISVAKNIRHIRHHARKHHQEHETLKELLRRQLYRENLWPLFAGTFLVVIILFIVGLNFGRITSFFTGGVEEGQPPLTVHGAQSGVTAAYMVNGQTADQYIRLVRQIPTEGQMIGIRSSDAIGRQREAEAETRQDAFLSSILLSTELSKGYHLTPVRTAKSLQKSVLTTYYLGEKTVDITSTLAADTQLLSKINNALSVDIFAYLNQSSSRADALDNFIHLLETLQAKAQERSADLASKINFLTANSQATERSISLTEDAFFESLQIFQGEDAEQQLGDFIGLQQTQTETQAKIGAYQGLKDYYDFFLPRLDNHLRAIKANRDPLIAGVKVIEIQNMTLPLIIRER